MRLSDVADSRHNNFDVLRLVAAAIVLLSHSYFLADRRDPLEAAGLTFGALGVALFFSMSGFLIIKSWTFDPKPGNFLRKRALRIMPALWVVLLVTTFVIGPAVSTLSLLDYFTAPGTWLYLIAGSLLFTFGGTLPGVFEDNPYPVAVNGSLWTLPVEASAYVMVLLLGVIGALRHRILLPIFFALLVALTAVFQGHAPQENVRLYAYFFAGMTMYAYRERIQLRWIPAVAGTAAWVASFGTPVMVPLGAVVLPYLLLVIAYRTPAVLRSVSRFGDVSYGLYIYAFPVQQLVALAIGDGVEPWMILVTSAPIAWLLGLASWRLVERPALRLKRPSAPFIERGVEIPPVATAASQSTGPGA